MSAWPELFCVSFYRLKQSEIDTMEDALLEKIPDLGADEVLSAVKTVAERIRTGSLRINGKVTVQHLISAVIRNRFVARNGESALMIGPIQTKLNNLRGMILRAGNNEERWTIICDGTKEWPIETVMEIQEICPRLEEFTRERFPGFERPRFNSFMQKIGQVANAKEEHPETETRPTPEMRKKLRELGGEDVVDHTRSMGHVEETGKEDPATRPEGGTGTREVEERIAGSEAEKEGVVGGTPAPDANRSGDDSDLFTAAGGSSDEF